jgi:F-box interacting protein
MFQNKRTIMVELSIEIIVYEILTWLPAKIAGRCKSVCKEWYKLITEDTFVKKHLCRSFIFSNQKILLINNQGYSISPINFEKNVHEKGMAKRIPFFLKPTIDIFFDVCILSNLNGLLCVELSDTSELILWNPITNAYKSLPSQQFNGFYKDILDAIGLYIDNNGDFKVLYIRRRDNQVYANVYSTSKDSWRNIPLILKPEFTGTEFYWSTGTFCGDKLYFAVSSCLSDGLCFMISYDVNSEKFKGINFPTIPKDQIANFRLLNAKNELHLFIASGYRQMIVHMWKYDGQLWSLIYKFPPMTLD